MKLRGKLALSVFIPLAVILVIVVRVDLVQTRARAIESAENRLSGVITNAAARLDGQFQRIAQIADTAAIAVADSDEWTTEELLGLSHSIVARDPIILGFGVAWEPDASPIPGQPYLGFAQRADAGVVESDLAVHFDYLENRYYQQVKKTRQPAWSLPFFDHVATGTEVVTYLAPVVESNTFRGIVAVDIGARTFESLAARIGLDKRPWLILDQAATVIAASPEGSQRLAGRDSVSGASLEEILKSAGLRADSANTILKRLDRVDDLVDTVYPVQTADGPEPQPRVAAIARVRSTGWLLITGTSSPRSPTSRMRWSRTRDPRVRHLASLAVGRAPGDMLRPVRRLVATVTWSRKAAPRRSHGPVATNWRCSAGARFGHSPTRGAPGDQGVDGGRARSRIPASRPPRRRRRGGRGRSNPARRPGATSSTRSARGQPGGRGPRRRDRTRSSGGDLRRDHAGMRPRAVGTGARSN